LKKDNGKIAFVLTAEMIQNKRGLHTVNLLKKQPHSLTKNKQLLPVCKGKKMRINYYEAYGLC